MILARGRFWRASLQKHVVAFEIQRVALPEELQELRDARFEVPLAKWSRLIKHLYSDRKLLGGLLLDFAKQKDRVSAVIGNDRLLAEFRRAVSDATFALLEQETLLLAVAGEPEEDR